jgi:hypothetical protein
VEYEEEANKQTSIKNEKVMNWGRGDGKERDKGMGEE